jgi:hypothetical protein
MIMRPAGMSIADPFPSWLQLRHGAATELPNPLTNQHFRTAPFIIFRAMFARSEKCHVFS